MADLSGGGSGDGNDGPLAGEIRRLALEIRERANDLRMIEVLDYWGVGADQVGATGDSGTAAWNGFDGDAARVKDAYETTQGIELGTEFDDIPSLFEKYTKAGSQYSYDAAREDLEAAAVALGKNTGVTNTGGWWSEYNAVHDKTGLTVWVRDAADAFRYNCLGPLASVPTNQLALINELQVALEGHWKLVAAAHQAAHDIAAAAKTALDAAIGSYQPEPVDVEAVFSIVGAALAVGAVFVPGTQGLALTLAFYTAANSAAGVTLTPAVSSVAQTSHSMSGDTVDWIVGTMRAAIVALDAEIIAEENALMRALEADLDEVSQALSGGTAATLRGARTAVADKPSTADFGYLG